MAFTPWSGKGGKVSLGGTPVDLPVVNWQGKESIDTVETTNALSSGWKTRITQNKDLTGSMTVVYDSGDAEPETAFALGASLAGKLYKGGSTKFISGTFIIKSRTWKVSPRNPAAVEVDIEFESDGAVTHG